MSSPLVPHNDCNSCECTSMGRSFNILNICLKSFHSFSLRLSKLNFSNHLQICAPTVVMVWCIFSEGISFRHESICKTVLLNTDSWAEERQTSHLWECTTHAGYEEWKLLCVWYYYDWWWENLRKIITNSSQKVPTITDRTLPVYSHLLLLPRQLFLIIDKSILL